MPVDSFQLKTLGAIVGAEAVSSKEADRARFHVDGATPAVVVCPESADQVAEIVRWAAKEKVGLMPVTSGRFLPLGNAPRAADVALSLERMEEVTAYDPGDLTLSVQAGCTLKKLAPVLSAQRQHLPADPPSADEAGLGGLVAANVNGPLRHGFGTWRDFVVGLEFITGEGKLVKAGGRVVKNVAGYDLTKLLIGSLGSLGIITQLNFRAFPLPEQTATFIATFETLTKAMEFRSRVAHSHLQPTRLELLDARSTGLLKVDGLSDAHWNVALSCGGVQAVIDRYKSELNEIAPDCDAVKLTMLEDEYHASLWDAVCNFLPRAAKQNPLLTVVKCPLPMTQLGPFIERAVAVAERYELPTAVTAHAGVAVAHIYYMPEGADVEDAAFRCGQAATETIHAGNNLQGRVTLPWTVNAVKQNVNAWGPLKDDFTLMRKLKAKFDPAGALNPGRFVGGL